ncbi:MAG: hypothetical protein NUV70_08950, partial [Caldiserica bacterium]|nr:hypothetical protein [Caldisericota bacterium]
GLGGEFTYSGSDGVNYGVTVTVYWSLFAPIYRNGILEPFRSPTWSDSGSNTGKDQLPWLHCRCIVKDILWGYRKFYLVPRAE